MLDFIAGNAGVIGLLFFFSTFIGVAIWAFRPGAKQAIESHKYIPLSEDSNDRN